MPGDLAVLVADDEAIHRHVLRKLFEGFGCAVTTVADGAEALAAAGTFDLVCLDRRMPVLSGDAAAKAFGGHAFVVACTSDATDLPGDFDMLLQKPVSRESIGHALQAARLWRHFGARRAFARRA